VGLPKGPPFRRPVLKDWILKLRNFFYGLITPKRVYNLLLDENFWQEEKDWSGLSGKSDPFKKV